VLFHQHSVFEVLAGGCGSSECVEAAVRANNAGVVAQALRREPALAGPALLERAVRAEAFAVAALLLRCPAVGIAAEAGAALHAAVATRQRLLARMLLQCGADANARDARGRTPLFAAAQAGDAPAVSELLACAMTDPDARADGGRTPLHAAVLAGALSCVRRLVRCARVECNARDDDGATPAHLAARNANNVGTHIVIDGNIAREELERGPAYVAKHAKLLRTAVFRELVRCERVDLDVLDGAGMAPLHYAAQFGRFDFLRVVANERGPRHFEIRTRERNQTCLHVAADYGRVMVVHMLKDVPEIDKNAVDADQRTALHIAAANGHPEIIQCLLGDEGVEINRTDKWVALTCMTFDCTKTDSTFRKRCNGENAMRSVIGVEPKNRSQFER
jgi:ankyrin repeat protein